MESDLNFLNTRKGFNFALNHFKIVNKFIKDFELKNNLADLINTALNKELIKQLQVPQIINLILVDKFHYYVKSFNLKSSSNSALKNLSEQVKNWDLIDIVIVYYHPQIGQVLINPKDSASCDLVTGGLKENELCVMYIGNFNREFDNDIAKECAKSCISLIHGKKVTNSKLFNSSSAPIKRKLSNAKKAENIAITKELEEKTINIPSGTSQQVQKTGPKKLSPEYGIAVTNELFHNGNVEAWKKIIESYETKYPDMKVLVFYENEQVHDINTLFKWGKVKSGTMILFRIYGTEFKDVSKLRRYLFQGASHKFEDFLRGGPGQVLALF